MIAELRITPVESKESFLKETSEVVRILEGSPLSYQVHAMGTTLEGSLEEILDIVRRCHDHVSKVSERTLIELSIDDRSSPGGELERSMQHLREASFGVPLERLVKGLPTA